VRTDTVVFYLFYLFTCLFYRHLLCRPLPSGSHCTACPPARHPACLHTACTLLYHYASCCGGCIAATDVRRAFHKITLTVWAFSRVTRILRARACFIYGGSARHWRCRFAQTAYAALRLLLRTARLVTRPASSLVRAGRVRCRISAGPVYLPSNLWFSQRVTSGLWLSCIAAVAGTTFEMLWLSATLTKTTHAQVLLTGRRRHRSTCGRPRCASASGTLFFTGHRFSAACV